MDNFANDSKLGIWNLEPRMEAVHKLWVMISEAVLARFVDIIPDRVRAPTYRDESFGVWQRVKVRIRRIDDLDQLNNVRAFAPL